MLRVQMLPAEHGDALVLEYGTSGGRDRRFVVVDGGPENAYEGVRRHIAELLPADEGGRRVELLVVTHVDGDHIEGVVKLLQDDDLAVRPDDVWFNDWRHLQSVGDPVDEPTRLGPEAGEFLAALIENAGLACNAAFRGRAVVVPETPDEPLPSVTLPGGLRLTVVSPTFDTLRRLRKRWDKVIRDAGFTPGDTAAALRQFAARRWAKRPVTLGDERRRSTLDNSEANGSSIALVAEYRGRRVLLAGDAFAPELRAGLERFRRQSGEPEDEPLRLDGFKLPHHGSDKNLTPQLLDAIRCDHYLVSTNGKRFRHPDQQALAMLVERHRDDAPPSLLFNYESAYTKGWRDRPDCRARYGADSVLCLSDID